MSQTIDDYNKDIGTEERARGSPRQLRLFRPRSSLTIARPAGQSNDQNGLYG